jgi:hypothetical protein
VFDLQAACAWQLFDANIQTLIDVVHAQIVDKQVPIVAPFHSVRPSSSPCQAPPSSAFQQQFRVMVSGLHANHQAPACVPACLRFWYGGGVFCSVPRPFSLALRPLRPVLNQAVRWCGPSLKGRRDGSQEGAAPVRSLVRRQADRKAVYSEAEDAGCGGQVHYPMQRQMVADIARLHSEEREEEIIRTVTASPPHRRLALPPLPAQRWSRVLPGPLSALAARAACQCGLSQAAWARSAGSQAGAVSLGPGLGRARMWADGSS